MTGTVRNLHHNVNDETGYRRHRCRAVYFGSGFGAELQEGPPQQAPEQLEFGTAVVGLRSLAILLIVRSILSWVVSVSPGMHKRLLVGGIKTLERN